MCVNIELAGIAVNAAPPCAFAARKNLDVGVPSARATTMFRVDCYFIMPRYVNAFSDSRTIPGMWVVAMALVALAGFICAGMVGAPQIFSDEYGYLATIIALHTGNWNGLAGTVYRDFLPNQLYFALYSITARAGDPFALARIVNVAWLCIGGLVLCGAAFKSGVLRYGVILLLAFGLGPLASYSVYFMPETLFEVAFFCACVLGAWTARSDNRVVASLCGAFLAAIPFIKPHGWLAVVVVACLLAWNAVARRRSAEEGRGPPLWLVALAFVVCWTIFHLALPDAPGKEKMFGNYAGARDVVLQTLASPDRYVSILGLIGVHLAIVGSLAAPALVYGLYAALRINPGVQPSESEWFARTLAGITAVSLIAFIVLTAVFCVGIAGTGPYESIDRLHTRYYSFAMPLLVLAFLGSPVSREWNNTWQTAVLLLWALACVCAFIVLPKYHWTIVDAPDLLVGSRSPRTSIAVIGAAGLLLAFVCRRFPQRLKLGVVAGYACAAILAGLVARSIQVRWTDVAEDRAGRFVAALAQQQHVPIVIVADMSKGEAWPYRVASYAPASVRFSPPDRNLRASGDPMRGGTILIGAPQDLPMDRLELIARFGERTVARVAGGAGPR